MKNGKTPDSKRGLPNVIFDSYIHAFLVVFDLMLLEFCSFVSSKFKLLLSKISCVCIFSDYISYALFKFASIINSFTTFFWRLS